MKTKIFLLVAACVVLAQGKSLDTSKLKRQLLSKTLSRIRGLDSKIFNWPWDDDSEEEGVTPGPDRKGEKIEEVQKILGMLSEALDAFKQKNGNGNDEDLQKEIDNVAFGIQDVAEKLNTFYSDSSLEDSLWDLYSELYNAFGLEFDNAFWDELLASESEKRSAQAARMQQSLDETGNDLLIPPAQQLKMLSDILEDIKYTVDELVDAEGFAYRLTQALITAVSHVSSDTTTTEAPTESITHFSNSEDTTTPTTTTPDTTTPGGSTESTTWGWRKRSKQLRGSRLVDRLKNAKRQRRVQ